MCENASSIERRVIQNVSYAICPTCDKPLRGTGQTLGGLAIFVVKPFVRAGQLVDFPSDWQRLCEHVGFQLLERIEASLIEEHGIQEGLFGDVTQHKIGRAHV